MPEKICENGHTFFKSSDCLVCPICEANKIPKEFMKALSAPARRALENIGIDQVEDLTRYSEKEILDLHGLGPSALPHLHKALKDRHLDFKT